MLDDADPTTLDPRVQHHYLGAIDQLERFDPAAYSLVNAIGSASLPKTRCCVFERALALGFAFHGLVHPAAVVSDQSEIGAGAQVLAGSVVATGARLGENTLINTKCSVDHDTTVGPHTHIAPGVTVCGGVSIGAGCHIGCGATIVQGVSIDDGVLVAAGAVVTRDVPADTRVAGVPARAW